MILNVLIIAIVGGVAYFHYAQGFFSATFSAVCAVIAAVLALSYHEPVILTLLQGKAADYATAMTLCGLFALIYIVLRVIVDKVVPGNIRLPVAIDRVGGAVMGIVAGIFTAGIVALAAQSLPFGPSVGGFARYEVQDRDEVNIPSLRAGGAQRTADIHDQITENTFTPEKRKKLFIPADDILLSVVQGLSNGGSMAGDRPLSSIHPDYAEEMFGQRLGIQIGASRTALNLPGKTQQVTVPEPGVFRVDQDLTKTQVDAEIGGLHDRAVNWTRSGGDVQLVVRVMFDKDASDSDHILRISPGAVRLCTGAKNFYPIGTLEKGTTLWSNKIDDFLIVDMKAEDRGVDFVFLIDDPEKVLSGGPKDPVQKVKDGVFIEVKRLARVDLSGREVKAGAPPASKKVQVERKPSLGGAKAGAGAAAGGGADTTAAAAPSATEFVFGRAEVSKQLFSPINVASPEADIRSGQIADGTFATQSKQFTQLDIKPTRALQVLSQGGYAVSELFEPNGRKMVQIVGTPPPEGGDPWAWGQLSKWKLADAAGHTYTPAGAFAKVKKDTAERMAATYRIEGAPPDIAAEDGRPVDVWIAFLVPPGTHLKSVSFNNKKVADLDQAVP